MPDVVRVAIVHLTPSLTDFIFQSHASIDPATRAARGLPEDLIRLCVGIEDPTDLLEDLEFALVEAGALVPQAIKEGITYVRPHPIATINKVINKLANVSKPKRFAENREWLVSAPGKVIMFGEHAVVHGVVRPLHQALIISIECNIF